MKKIYLVALCLLGMNTFAQKKIIVDVPNKVSEIQPTMWGVFFEDINMGADGGIYAELIKNRSFEFFKPLMGWNIEYPAEAKKEILVKLRHEGEILVQNRMDKNTANPRYITVTVNNTKKGELGLSNEGFKAMGFKSGLRYDFSVLARVITGSVKMHIELLNAKKEVIGSTLITPNSNEWTKLESSFNALASEAKGTFRVWFEGTGVVDLDMISLFPSDTWKGRKGGMRADMIQLLADMKPGFVRFPGGCIVEGFDLNNRYQWKKTLGPIEERQLIMNRWNIEFTHRPAPDYFQTFGLGFFEYFQLCDDIGAAPLPILNCGMACQFNSAEVVPLDQIQPYVEDALDLIEFANGDVSTKWGKIRADMGHPTPFNLKMMGIGNENWGPQYVERLKIFTKAIKDKYPTIKLVNSSGIDPESRIFQHLNTELRAMNADIIDEHYYNKPDWFLKNAGRYDSYDRNGSKVFAGEYAAQSDHTVSVDNKNSWNCALSEAAFMTGLERNAAVVTMASYAPLFAHADGWQWTPDLIWVDNLRSYGTPNYYVQKLYSNNKGTHVLPITESGSTIAGKDSLYAAAAWDKNANEVIVKIVNVSGQAQNHELSLAGVKKMEAIAKAFIMQNDNLNEVNSFENATKVSPIEKDIAVDVKKKMVSLNLPAKSFIVYRIKVLEK
jgi:alpha-N-arabinofuranosidase